MPITFKADSLRKIREGTKTQTRRAGRQVLKVGSVYGAKDDWYRKADTYVCITRRFKQRLGDITPEDIRKEGFSSSEEFKAAWIHLHGDWTPNKNVTVYEFRLAKKNGHRQTRINGS